MELGRRPVTYAAAALAPPARSPLRGEPGRTNTAVVASERARRGEPVCDQSKGVRLSYGRLAAPQSASGRNAPS